MYLLNFLTVETTGRQIKLRVPTYTILPLNIVRYLCPLTSVWVLVRMQKRKRRSVYLFITR